MEKTTEQRNEKDKGVTPRQVFNITPDDISRILFAKRIAQPEISDDAISKLLTLNLKHENNN